MGMVIVAGMFSFHRTFFAKDQLIYERGPGQITDASATFYYNGNCNWKQMANPSEPVLAIKTTKPVILENCDLKGRDDLIRSTTPGANITVKNTNGYGLNPLASKPDGMGHVKGHFANIQGAGRVVIENNHLEGTRGIFIRKWTHEVAREEIKIRYNEVLNIDGRRSDPNNTSGPNAGYSTDKVNGFVREANFVRLTGVHDVPGVEIAWNEIKNLPNQSRVEDTISIYGSGGNKANPFLIHDNLIDGAFPIDPARPVSPMDRNKNYSGGGIITDNPSANTYKTADQYVHIYKNQILDSLNYGAKITQGHHNKLSNNRVVRDGVLSDGTKYLEEKPDGTLLVGDVNRGAGIALVNSNKQASAVFTNNHAYENGAAWYDPDPEVSGKLRNFSENWRGTCLDSCSWHNHSLIPTPLHDLSVVINQENEERQLWQKKLAQNDITLGPFGTGTTPSDTTITLEPSGPANNASQSISFECRLREACGRNDPPRDLFPRWPVALIPSKSAPTTPPVIQTPPPPLRTSALLVSCLRCPLRRRGAAHAENDQRYNPP
jgi:hypothetical protein